MWMKFARVHIDSSWEEGVQGWQESCISQTSRGPIGGGDLTQGVDVIT